MSWQYALHDITLLKFQCVYPNKLTSFQSDVVPEPVSVVPVIEREKEALEEINVKLGLAFDEQDINYYTHLFSECNILFSEENGYIYVMIFRRTVICIEFELECWGCSIYIYIVSLGIMFMLFNLHM